MTGKPFIKSIRKGKPHTKLLKMSQAFDRLRRKIVERHGKSGIRIAVNASRSASDVLDPSCVRESLRANGVWIPDEDFELMVAASQPDGVFDVNRFVKGLIGDIGSRRVNVLQVLWERLDPNHNLMVPIEVFLGSYDVQRHPDVKSNRRPAADVAADFFAIFEDNSIEAQQRIVSKESLFAYYSGVSLLTERNDDFELLIARSFALDRPKGAAGGALGGSSGSLYESALLSKQKALGSTMGRAHPLYQTSASVIGSVPEGTPVPEVDKSHFRTGEFTKHAPPPSGASGMNTSTSRGRV